MCQITRSESFVMCTARMLIARANPSSEAPFFTAPPFSFESYYLAPDLGCPHLADNIRRDHSRRQYSCWQPGGPLHSCCFPCLRSVWLVSHIPSLEQSLLTNSTSAHWAEDETPRAPSKPTKAAAITKSLLESLPQGDSESWLAWHF